jgi:hypothetical protein
MNKKTKIFLLAAVLSTTLAGLFTSGQFAVAGGEYSKNNETEREEDEDSDKVIALKNGNVLSLKNANTIPLKEAKLNIEHNAKDNDTGYQGFIDSEGWQWITAIGPDGKVLKFEGKKKLGKLGLTELFFETVEPPNAEVPIEEILETLPEGNYEFKGSAIEVGEKMGMTIGTAWLTHDIPAGPVLLTPAEDAVVPVQDLLVSWETVDETIDGSPIDIIAYQLIIEKDETPHPHMIGKMGLSIYLPDTVTQITIPGEFFEPGTAYKWEVLAIEESGNQTLMSSQFSTEP